MKIYSKGKMLEVPSCGSQDIYSTEEQVVGRWIDGKPVYQRSWKNIGPVNLSSSSVSTTITIPGFTLDMQILEYSGRLIRSDGLKITIPSTIVLAINENNELIMLATAFIGNYNIESITLKYTKTTDQATIELPAALTAAPAQAPFTAASPSTAAVTLDAGIKNKEV